MTRLEDAPASLIHALRDGVGDVVPVGAPFDATDVVQIGKSRRLIFIWNRGTRWVVAIEHGGIVYNHEAFAFDIDRQGEAKPVRHEIGDACWTAPHLIEDTPLK